MRIQSMPRNILALSLASCGFLTSCIKGAVNPPSTTNTSSITQVIENATNDSLFTSLIKKTGLDSTLKGTGPFTVFLSTDTSFKAAGFNAAYISNTADSILFRMATYAIIDGSSLGSLNLPVGPDAKIITAGGDSIYVSNSPNGIYVNGIFVTETDVAASNGTINILLSPLIPPQGSLLQTLQADTNFSFMSAAITRASQGSTNLDSILLGSPYTIFVPVNSSFQSVGYSTLSDINNANPDSLASLVTCHILAQRLFSSDFIQINEPVNLNGSTLDILPGAVSVIKGSGNSSFVNITTSNIMASNGVIHIISGVLLP
jgi:uncharacterized surface protein with fasciclin (FAS1) repeats